MNEIYPDNSPSNITIKKSSSIESPVSFKNKHLNAYSGSKDLITIYRPNIIYLELIKGKEIRYKILSDIDPMNLSIFILNIPLGYLLFQASKFVLHASAIEMNQKGILFCGFSKSGKSSTVNYMLKYGNMISEDICLLEFKNKKAFVTRSFPGIKIDKSHFDLDKSKDLSIIGNRDRFFQKIEQDKFCKKEITEIKKIIILDWHEDESIEILKGADIFKSILPHVFKIPYDEENNKIFYDSKIEEKQLEVFNHLSEIKIVKYLRPKNNKTLFLESLKNHILQ